MNSLRDRYQDVQSRIANAIRVYHRAPESVKLIAVSKTKSVEAVRELATLGQRAFGESYLQEALSKIEQLSALDLEWHFIGPIQSNKTKLIANAFDWVHSVDREKIAKRLSEQRDASLAALNICVQVNISGEATKSGVSPSELPEMVRAITALPNLQLRGLMAIPAPHDDIEKQRVPFRELARLLTQLNKEQNLTLDTLSMGMSDDLEAAIAEGATMIRVGTDIFGER